MYLSHQDYIPSAHFYVSYTSSWLIKYFVHRVCGIGSFRDSDVNDKINDAFKNYNEDIRIASTRNKKLAIIATLTKEILLVKPLTNRNESTICCLLQYLLLENNPEPVVMSDLVKDFSAKDI